MGTYWSIEECAWLEHVQVAEGETMELPEPRQVVVEPEGALTLS